MKAWDMQNNYKKKTHIAILSTVCNEIKYKNMN